MRRILINATQPEEVRVALVDGQKLYDLDIESIGRAQKKANIYKGKITRIEPSLEAVFVDYGSERHGFLSFKEINRDYYRTQQASNSRPNIKDVLHEGQELLIQIDKEERGNKGAALTTFISLAGCYLVLMPNNPRAGGISRRIEGDDRDELRDIINTLTFPEGMGIIVRTAGVGKSLEELQWDLDTLLQSWQEIQQAVKESPVRSLIHQESDVVIRSIRDYLRKDIGEIVIDDPIVFEKAKDYVQKLRPDAVSRVKLYKDTAPLFNRFQIESQIESAYHRQVQLPSGGALVIDHTEALITIDVNSARATKGGDIEETAFNTNLEAADEVARQLRLRDLGGLIVIDFIDMSNLRNRRDVEVRLREALKMDRARVQVGRISRFGLLEMSRQRLRPSLGEASQEVCPRCNGQGNIRGIESLALSILRVIEDDAMKDNTIEVHVQLPIDVATYLLNEKRNGINTIEKRHDVNIILIPNNYIQTPNYDIRRVRVDETTIHGQAQASYKMIAIPQIDKEEVRTEAAEHLNVPAVKNIAAATPPKSSGSLLKRLWQGLFGATSGEITPLGTEEEQSEEGSGGTTTSGSGRNQPRRNAPRGTQQSSPRGPRSPNPRQPTQRRSPHPRNTPRDTTTDASDEVATTVEASNGHAPQRPARQQQDRRHEGRSREPRQGGQRYPQRTPSQHREEAETPVTTFTEDTQRVVSHGDQPITQTQLREERPIRKETVYESTTAVAQPTVATVAIQQSSTPVAPVVHEEPISAASLSTPEVLLQKAAVNPTSHYKTISHTAVTAPAPTMVVTPPMQSKIPGLEEVVAAVSGRQEYVQSEAELIASENEDETFAMSEEMETDTTTTTRSGSGGNTRPPFNRRRRGGSRQFRSSSHHRRQEKTATGEQDESHSHSQQQTTSHYSSNDDDNKGNK